MSSTQPARRTRQVSTQHKAAAAISVVYAVLQIVFSIPAINQGSSGNSSGVPWGVLVVGFAIAVVMCVAAYGVWTGQRWGVVLTIVMNALSFVIGAPGILFADKTFLVVSSIIGCLVNLVAIGLLLYRSRGRAGATSRSASSSEATV